MYNIYLKKREKVAQGRKIINFFLLCEFYIYNRKKENDHDVGNFFLRPETFDFYNREPK